MHFFSLNLRTDVYVWQEAQASNFSNKMEFIKNYIKKVAHEVFQKYLNTNQLISPPLSLKIGKGGPKE